MLVNVMCRILDQLSPNGNFIAFCSLQRGMLYEVVMEDYFSTSQL